MRGLPLIGTINLSLIERLNEEEEEEERKVLSSKLEILDHH